MSVMLTDGRNLRSASRDALESLTRGESLARPPLRRDASGRWARADAGEWDWFYAELSTGDQSYLRKLMAPRGHGLAPDQLALVMRVDDVETAMREWARVALLGRREAGQKFDDWYTASWQTDSVPPEPGILIGPLEIAELLEVKPNTVHQWIARGLLPEPWDVVSGTRLWPKYAIEEWAVSSGRYESVPADEPEQF